MARTEENTGLVFLFIGIGGIGAYFTNYAGFKDWVDYNLFSRPQEYQEPNPDDEGVWDKEFEGDKPPKKVNPPPQRIGTVFNCTSYPRCNTVTGTDARKTCCCKNKCALLGRTFKSIDLFKGICLCNPKPAPAPIKCTGPCPPGKIPKATSSGCTCANCTNTCAACYRRGAGCTCHYDSSMIKPTSYAKECKIGCNGYTSWTNYPCPNRGAKTQSTVSVSGSDATKCAAARAKWLSQWGCKSSYAQTQAYPANVYNNYAQVPTVA